MESLVKLEGLNRTKASELAARNAGLDEDEIESVARHLRRLYARKHGPGRPDRDAGGIHRALPGIGVLYHELDHLITSIDIELGRAPSASRRRELEAVLREIEERLERRLAILVNLTKAERERQVERDVIRVDQLDPLRLVAAEIEQLEKLLESLGWVKLLVPS